MKKYDVIVLGGGFAGVAAAISASEGGAKVLLIEKANCLGGAAANCLVQPYMTYSTKIDGSIVDLSSGIFKRINDELKKLNAEFTELSETRAYSRFYEEFLKIVLNRMVLGAGAEILFHSYLIDAYIENGSVKNITVAGKSGLLTFEADYFIDASGDADLAVKAGYPYRLGREEDGLCQPMTLCFRLANVDIEYKELPRSFINNTYRQLQKEGKIKNIREDVLIFDNPIKGILHFNSTRVVKHNPTDVFDLTRAEIDAREQVLELYSFLKKNIPGFEKSELIMTASEIGIRESRMIDGEYILTGEDLKACTYFEDAIALGNYDIDIHNPEGSGTSHYYFKEGEYYTIPYRSLIPKNSKNLLVAGRCISADHYAQASIRIMPIVCCIGEAAGNAVAIAKADKCSIKEIDIKKLRENLKKNGARIEI